MGKNKTKKNKRKAEESPESSGEMKERRVEESEGEELEVVELMPAEEVETEERSEVVRPWPRTLFVEGADLKKVSLLKAVRGLRDAVGPVLGLSRQANGSLIVQAGEAAQADQLLQISSLCGVGVRVTPHRGMRARGVVVSGGLLHDSERDVLEELQPLGVVEVKRLSSRRDGRVVPTASLLLTFGGTELPSQVTIGFLSLRVRPYVPSPLRCFKCLRYGHTQATCGRKMTCARCGSSEHAEAKSCSAVPKCVGCGGEHSAFSRECPIWLREKEVQKVKVRENLPYPEAAKRVPLPVPLGKSFAAMAAGQPRPPAPSGRPFDEKVASQTAAQVEHPAKKSVYTQTPPVVETASASCQVVPTMDAETQTTITCVSEWGRLWGGKIWSPEEEEEGEESEEGEKVSDVDPAEGREKEEEESEKDEEEMEGEKVSDVAPAEEEKEEEEEKMEEEEKRRRKEASEAGCKILYASPHSWESAGRARGDPRWSPVRPPI